MAIVVDFHGGLVDHRSSVGRIGSGGRLNWAKKPGWAAGRRKAGPGAQEENISGLLWGNAARMIKSRRLRAIGGNFAHRHENPRRKAQRSGADLSQAISGDQDAPEAPDGRSPARTRSRPGPRAAIRPMSDATSSTKPSCSDPAKCVQTSGGERQGHTNNARRVLVSGTQSVRYALCRVICWQGHIERPGLCWVSSRSIGFFTVLQQVSGSSRLDGMVAERVSAQGMMASQSGRGR